MWLASWPRPHRLATPTRCGRARIGCAIRGLTMGDADAAYAADPLIHLGPRGHVGRIELGYWYSRRELKDLTRHADADRGVPSVIELEALACQHRIPDACVRPPGLCASSSRTESRTAMNSTDPPPQANAVHEWDQGRTPSKAPSRTVWDRLRGAPHTGPVRVPPLERDDLYRPLRDRGFSDVRRKTVSTANENARRKR